MNKDILDHVAICTDSIEKSVKWYTENFKCEILYQDNTWAMLEFQNVKLALVLPEQHPFHFAILKDNVEDYIAFYIVGAVAFILLVLLYFRKRLRPCLDYFTCNKVDDDDDV